MKKAITAGLFPAAFAAALMLNACAVDVPPPGAVFVPVGPPPVQTEVIGVAPGRDYIWIGGHHIWNGSAYAWSAGRWEARPRRNVKWRSGRWVHHSKGWYWHDGQWR